MATAYAVSNGVYTDSEGMCNWWLRTCGKSRVDFADHWPGYAAFVTKLGAVDGYGEEMDFSIIGIRPALWINLN